MDLVVPPDDVVPGTPLAQSDHPVSVDATEYQAALEFVRAELARARTAFFGNQWLGGLAVYQVAQGQPITVDAGVVQIVQPNGQALRVEKAASSLPLPGEGTDALVGVYFDASATDRATIGLKALTLDGGGRYLDPDDFLSFVPLAYAHVASGVLYLRDARRPGPGKRRARHLYGISDAAHGAAMGGAVYTQGAQIYMPSFDTYYLLPYPALSSAPLDPGGFLVLPNEAVRVAATIMLVDEMPHAIDAAFFDLVPSFANITNLSQVNPAVPAVGMNIAYQGADADAKGNYNPQVSFRGAMWTLHGEWIITVAPKIVSGEAVAQWVDFNGVAIRCRQPSNTNADQRAMAIGNVSITAEVLALSAAQESGAFATDWTGYGPSGSSNPSGGTTLGGPNGQSGITTLTADIDAVTTTVPVADADALYGAPLLLIDNELVAYGGNRQGNTLQATRAINNVRQAHQSGATVTAIPIPTSFQIPPVL